MIYIAISLWLLTSITIVYLTRDYYRELYCQERLKFLSSLIEALETSRFKRFRVARFYLGLAWFHFIWFVGIAIVLPFLAIVTLIKVLLKKK